MFTCIEQQCHLDYYPDPTLYPNSSTQQIRWINDQSRACKGIVRVRRKGVMNMLLQDDGSIKKFLPYRDVKHFIQSDTIAFTQSHSDYTPTSANVLTLLPKIPIIAY